MAVGNMINEETKNWTFHHLGVIVADMDKTVEYYKSLGFIDFPPEKPRPTTPAAPPATWQEFSVYGEPVIKDGKLMVPAKPGAKPGMIKWCWMGTIALELTLPGDGAFRTVHNDFLDNVGEGIEHIAYGVSPENFDEEVERMKAKQLPVVMSGSQSKDSGFIYFDTRKVGGIITELMKVRS